MLADLDAWLNAARCLAGLRRDQGPGAGEDRALRAERTIDPSHFYPTLDEAVAAYVAETGATWQDARAGRRRSDRDRARSPSSVPRPPASSRRPPGWPTSRSAPRSCSWSSSCPPVGRAARRSGDPGGRWSSPPGSRCRGVGRPGLVALGVGAAALVVFAVVMVASESLRVLVVGAAPGRARRPASARVALRPPSVDPAQVRRAPPRPRHAVLIMNLWSGGGKAERFELERLCRERGIEPVVLVQGLRPARARRGRRRARRGRHRHGRR